MSLRRWALACRGRDRQVEEHQALRAAAKQEESAQDAAMERERLRALQAAQVRRMLPAPNQAPRLARLDVSPSQAAHMSLQWQLLRWGRQAGWKASTGRAV